MQRSRMIAAAAVLGGLALTGCEQPQGGDEPLFKGDDQGGGNGVPGGVGPGDPAEEAKELGIDLSKNPYDPHPQTSQQRFAPDPAGIPDYIRKEHHEFGGRAGGYAVCAADDSGRVVNYYPNTGWGWRQAVDQCQTPGI